MANKPQPTRTKKTIVDEDGNVRVVTFISVPSRKYRPLPPNVDKYAPPRPALVRSATPIAHIAHPKWKKSKPKKTDSSSD